MSLNSWQQQNETYGNEKKVDRRWGQQRENKIFQPSHLWKCPLPWIIMLFSTVAKLLMRIFPVWYVCIGTTLQLILCSECAVLHSLQHHNHNSQHLTNKFSKVYHVSERNELFWKTAFEPGLAGF